MYTYECITFTFCQQSKPEMGQLDSYMEQQYMCLVSTAEMGQLDSYMEQQYMVSYYL